MQEGNAIFFTQDNWAGPEPRGQWTTSRRVAPSSHRGEAIQEAQAWSPRWTVALKDGATLSFACERLTSLLCTEDILVAPRRGFGQRGQMG
jgi:hypothetical protein